MNRAPTVAVVRSDNRRGAVAEALALVADDLRARVTPDVLIKTNGVSHRRQLPSTHADTLSATLDAVLAAGANRVVVAEGATDASAGFDRFGYRQEAFGRPVEFLDINRDESAWDRLELTGGRRLAADRADLADGRLGPVPGLARADEDSCDVDGHVQPQEHAVEHPPRRPDHDARPRRGRQRVRGLEAAGGRVPQGGRPRWSTP